MNNQVRWSRLDEHVLARLPLSAGNYLLCIKQACWYVNVQIDAHGKATELHEHHNARDAVQSLMDAWYTLTGQRG